jgi:hypothetical protein
MMRNAILFSSHLMDDIVLSRLEKLKSEVPSGYDVYFFFDETKLKKRNVLRHAGTPVLEHGKDNWMTYKKPNRYFTTKIPGNEDGMLLSAFHRLPQYDYYWYLEYDVVYSGNWKDFFAEFGENRADMLSTNISRHDEIPDWPLWKSVEMPVGMDLPRNFWLRSFNPILRLSLRAMEVMTEECKKGWMGHSEAVMPTVLLQRGLILEDFGGSGEFTPPEREHRHYRSNRFDNSLAPGTFVFRPAMTATGDEPGKLWHPVKGAGHQTWDHDGLLVAMRKRFWPM